MKSSPNQKEIVCHEDQVDGYLFKQRTIDSELNALRRLPPSAFELWIFFSQNRDGFILHPSAKLVESAFGMKRDSYNKAIHDLEEAGFLIHRTKTKCDFFEYPANHKAENTKAGIPAFKNQEKPAFKKQEKPTSKSGKNPQEYITGYTQEDITKKEDENKSVCCTKDYKTDRQIYIPSIEEVRRYAVEKKATSDPEKFYKFNKERRWKKLHEPGMSWEILFDQWESNEFEHDPDENAPKNREIEDWNKPVDQTVRQKLTFEQMKKFNEEIGHPIFDLTSIQEPGSSDPEGTEDEKTPSEEFTY